MSELTFRFWPATRRLHIALDERESPLQVALQQALEDEARRQAEEDRFWYDLKLTEQGFGRETEQ